MDSQPSLVLIGAGYWGKNLARNFNALGALRVLCDANQPTLDTYGADYAGARKTTRVEQVLADPAITQVAIAAPAVLHYQLAKAALEASVRYLAYDLGPKKIRVNAISAGPVNTLAARGISGFGAMLAHYEAHAPLKRNITLEELGAMGVFLAADGSAGITGQTLYADSGYSVMGM